MNARRIVLTATVAAAAAFGLAHAAVEITGVQGTMLGVDNGIVLVDIQTKTKTTIVSKDTLSKVTGGYANTIALPRFSPDGKQVVFWVDWYLKDWSAKAPGAMYVADNNGRNITKICDADVAHAGIDYQSLSWCTDGCIYFSRQTDTILRVNPTTRVVEAYWSAVGVPGYKTDNVTYGPYVENLVVSRDGSIGVSSNGGKVHALDLKNKRLIESCGGGCRGAVTTNGDAIIHWLTCCGYYPPGYDGNNAFLKVTVFQSLKSCDSLTYMFAPGSAGAPNASALQYWMYRGACNDNVYVVGQGYGNDDGVLQNRITSDYLVIPKFPATDFYLGALPAPPAATARIKIDSTQLTFIAAGATAPAAKTVQVTNEGVGTLSDVTVAESAAWLTVTRSGSGNAQTLSNAVSTAGLARGTYSATVTVSGGGASNSVSYTVNLNVGSTVAAPTSLTAALTNNVNIVLHWTDNAGNENGFLVERKAGTGAWAQIKSLAANTAAFTDSSLAPAAYTYRVRAYAGTDTSGYSNEATATVTAAITIAVTAPTAGAVLDAGATFQVKWNAQNSSGVYIEYTLDDGLEWTRMNQSQGSIRPSDANWQNFAWTVPDTASTACMVRVVEYTLHSIVGTSGKFTIRNGTGVAGGTTRQNRPASQMVVINGVPVALTLPGDARGAPVCLQVTDCRGQTVYRDRCAARAATQVLSLPGGAYIASLRAGPLASASRAVIVP